MSSRLSLVFVYVVSLALANSQDSVRLPLLIVAAVIGLLGAIGFVVVAFSLYGLNNGSEPLGLPEGSVRALIALLILVIFASTTIFFFGAMRTPPPLNRTVDTAAANDLAKQVLTILGTLLTAITSFYFGSQSATSAVKAAAGGNSPAGDGRDAGSGAGGSGSQASDGGVASAGAGSSQSGADLSQSDDAPEAIDIPTTLDIVVPRPLKLKPRVVPDEKHGMSAAD